MEGKFMHGVLEASIFHATPYSPSCPFNWILFDGEKAAAFVEIKLNNTKVAVTSQQLDRTWNESFQILCAHPSHTTITLYLRTPFSLLGHIKISAASLLTQQVAISTLSPHDHPSFTLFTHKGKPIPNLRLAFRLRFVPAEGDPFWGTGLKSKEGDETFRGVTRGVSFFQRSNCEVTLYQDAHHRPSFRPPTIGEKTYRPRKLWEDVYTAMDGAKHLIYIAGWSLNPKMVLVRDPETAISHGRGVAIGDLLKRKAEEGVAVRIMLWDDETSIPIINNRGVMGTHCEDAFEYFKHTKVVCRLCPRLHHKFPTLFAHHQKTITVDAAKSKLLYCEDTDVSVGREILSFVGGLDLCDGRYDTEEHSLFRTLNTELLAHDFYQSSIEGASLHKGGPREPWHDTHARVTAGAAWDVLRNFEQRWTKQCNASLLPHIHSRPHLQRQTCSPSEEDANGWNVQVFRSIDHHSASPLPDNLQVECSIHDAYVEAIRRAKRFIYIENQYFIGGCDMWEMDQHCGCKNLIPVEIALKLVSKIKARERFAVYIVIPMWPEGLPTSDPVQDILHWTRLTMKMMYKLIGKAILESGIRAHPRDYLNFFCLANREQMDGGEFIPPSSPQHRSHYWEAQRHRRFMIYVHSKLMIVDDEYVLLGSANANQRSMDGQRDTEIAIGCYQPNFIGSETSLCRGGDVHAYRMSLWYEHTQQSEEVFHEPQTVECVRKLCKIGEEMWNKYSGEAIVDMEGVHLVSYPVAVSRDGCVGDLVEGGGTFPDTNTLIKGKRSIILTPTFTT